MKIVQFCGGLGEVWDPAKCRPPEKGKWIRKSQSRSVKLPGQRAA